MCVFMKKCSLLRQERCILSQLRCDGFCPLLQSYLHRIGKAEHPNCRFCLDCEDTVAHLLLECVKGDSGRFLHLGPNPGIEVLWTNPVGVVNYLRSSGRF